MAMSKSCDENCPRANFVATGKFFELWAKLKNNNENTKSSLKEKSFFQIKWRKELSGKKMKEKFFFNLATSLSERRINKMKFWKEIKFKEKGCDEGWIAKCASDVEEKNL